MFFARDLSGEQHSAKRFWPSAASQAVRRVRQDVATTLEESCWPLLAPALAAAQTLLQRLRVVLRNLHIGVLEREARQDVRHDAEDGRAINPHIQPSELAAPRTVRPVRRLVHHAEDGPGIAQQGIPRMREHHAARRALEELCSDFGLQGLDLPGGGLG